MNGIIIIRKANGSAKSLIRKATRCLVWVCEQGSELRLKREDDDGDSDGYDDKEIIIQNVQAPEGKRRKAERYRLREKSESKKVEESLLEMFFPIRNIWKHQGYTEKVLH